MSLSSLFATSIHRPPVVIMPQRVLMSMFAEAQNFIADPRETGETLIGLIVKPDRHDRVTEPLFYVLGTIPAGEALRLPMMFALGGDYQVKIFDWLIRNWDAQREASRSLPGYNIWELGVNIPSGVIPGLFDMDLMHVGDWHRHPGNMTHPSSGDLDTAKGMLLNPEMDIDYLISPIVTISNSGAGMANWNTDLLVHKQAGHQFQVSFSYLSERMLSLGMTGFVDFQPYIVPDSWLPPLPQLPWDITDARRFALEMRMLQEYGCVVTTFYRETRGGPPLEVCFEINRPAGPRCATPWDYRLLVETSANHPTIAPGVRIIKDEAPPAQPQQSVPPAQQPWYVDWLRRAIAHTPLVQLPQFPLPRLPQQTNGGPFTWHEHESTILSIVMYLESLEGGKLWKPQTTNGTASTATSEK